MAKAATRPAPDSLVRQARAFIAYSDAITELLTVQRRAQDAREPECSLSELRMLSALGRKEPVAMSDLAAALKVPLSTATRTADKLVKKKLVQRLRVKEDRRIVEIGFSEKGREINRFVATGRLAVARRLLGLIRPEDRVRLVEVMRMMLVSK